MLFGVLDWNFFLSGGVGAFKVEPIARNSVYLGFSLHHGQEHHR